MQAGKRYTFYQVLRWTRNYILLFLLWDTIPILLYYFFRWEWLVIPWQPISLIGIAVAFYLGFKNNAAYDRLWEARKIWGGIVNTSRSFTIMARDFVSNHFVENKVSAEELSGIHKTLVHRHVAWLYALSIQLRKLKAWEHNSEKHAEFRKTLGIAFSPEQFDKLKPYLSEDEFAYLAQKGNRASHLLSLQSKHLKELREAGLTDDFRHVELEKMLVELYTLQGKSERIKNFPLPRQYASANYFFVCIFIVLLPFSMLSIFGHLGGADSSLASYLIWLAIPFSALASWVFWVMESIGEYSENPFEGLYNDVPITSMARSIEIDIRQMLEEQDLPEPIGPVGDLKIMY